MRSKKAGLDPDKAPRTYDELKQAAKALTTDGQAGFTMLNYGWFFEQLVAAQGGLYVDNENGRAGAPTKAVFDGEEGQNAFNLIQQMYDDKTFMNVGQTGTICVQRSNRGKSRCTSIRPLGFGRSLTTPTLRLCGIFACPERGRPSRRRHRRCVALDDGWHCR